MKELQKFVKAGLSMIFEVSVSELLLDLQYATWTPMSTILGSGDSTFILRDTMNFNKS